MKISRARQVLREVAAPYGSQVVSWFDDAHSNDWLVTLDGKFTCVELEAIVECRRAGDPSPGVDRAVMLERVRCGRLCEKAATAMLAEYKKTGFEAALRASDALTGIAESIVRGVKP